MDESFFVSLVSNVKHDTFINRTGNFMNRLSTPLYFNEAYEVGVTRVVYTNSFYSLQNSADNTFYIAHIPIKNLNLEDLKYNLSSELISVKNSTFPLIKCVIPEGHYTKTDDFVAKLNRAIPQKHRNRDFIFAYDQNRGVVTITVNPSFLIILPRELRTKDFLGFNSTFILPGFHEAEFPLILTNLTHFYITADCVSPSLYGNKFIKLICTVPLGAAQRDANCEYVFDRIQYYPVISDVISNIHIQALNAELQPLIFQSGNCYIHLHFRKIRQS